jgi:hypothetical protein
MTISEMHTAFRLELDKVNSLQYPDFTAVEIDYWLNRAIREFVKTRYSGVNYKREGFEQSQKRIDDLRTLVREVTIPCGTSGMKPNGWSLLPGFNHPSFDTEPYWLSLGEEVDVFIIDSSTTIRQGVTEVTSDEYRFEIDNPYSTYRLHYGHAKPLRLFYNNTIEFISDDNYRVSNAYLRFLKKPAIVNSLSTPVVSCDLTDLTHDEIVSLAVKLVLENIEQPRLQAYSQNISTME